MRVLNLVTNADSQFFQEQVSVLEASGVESTTLRVPGSHVYGADDDEVGGSASRSVVDYLKFYPPVLRHSFDSYDLIHANYGLTAPAAIAQPNLPVVVSLWGSDLMGSYGPVTKFCAERSDAVIVMSEGMAHELDRDCHVIPHGIDLAKFRLIPQDEARAQLGWNPDAHHVLFPYPRGREVKNYPRAERVVERVRERIEERAENRIEGPIELQTASGVPHDEMALYFNAADVLLLTSRREGSPNTVKEAMACNLPVVSTDVGDVRRRLDGVSHCRVATSDERLADGVEHVLTTGERSNGREAIRSLSSERMGERIREVYEDVLSN